jgi:hypothetical protein
MEDKKYLVSLSNTLTHIFPALDTVLDWKLVEHRLFYFYYLKSICFCILWSMIIAYVNQWNTIGKTWLASSQQIEIFCHFRWSTPDCRGNLGGIAC